MKFPIKKSSTRRHVAYIIPSSLVALIVLVLYSLTAPSSHPSIIFYWFNGFIFILVY